MKKISKDVRKEKTEKLALALIVITSMRMNGITNKGVGPEK